MTEYTKRKLEMADKQSNNNLPSLKDEDLSPKVCGGILRRIIKPGFNDSLKATENSLVKIDLIGLYNGSVFDRRRNLVYSLGDGCIVDIPQGVELALSHFGLHEKSLVTLKSEFAFGKDGHEKFSIPPNATVEYEVTLKSVDFPLSKESLSLKEKYECAQHLKEKGNKCFQMGEHEAACRKYSQAVDYLSDIELSKEKEDYYDFLKSCYLNLALCSLKTNNPSDTVTWGKKVLELRPKDVKALYRIGLAYLAKQEPLIAREYFQQVLEVESDNQAAAKQLLHCQQLEEKVQASEKQLYMKMFSTATGV